MPPSGPREPPELEQLVIRALALSADDRDQALERMCAEHPDLASRLRDEVERLAALGDGLEAMLDEDSVPLPRSIGDYRILRRLGSGGMGVVYLAEQREPVRRRVALKVIKLGLDGRQVLRRFARERQVLAMMEHEHIAKVFDAGSTQDGQPYFVMEYVDGLPLDRYCDEHRLDVEERIELVRKVCAAVQHAHHKGIVHRDLKPGNVLVTLRGDEAVPKIIDFGLARAVSPNLLGDSVYTEHGRFVGTIEYMAPEQATGEGGAVDARADIYALGVILYELLSGERPFSRLELLRSGPAELPRHLREVEPPRPSTRISSLGAEASDVAQARRTSVRDLERRLRRDLDWVVMKAMAKEPERRYQAATALADDLGRYLRREPVEAGPPSAAYRLAKFVQRHRGGVLVSLVVSVVSLAAVVGVASSLARERAQGEALEMYHRVSRLRALAAAEREDPVPARPDRVEDLVSWRGHVEELLAGRPRMRAYVDELAALGARSSGPGILGEAGARSELAEFLRSALALAESMEGPRGELTAVRRRIAWAQGIAERTVDRHARAWAEAIERVRNDPRFPEGFSPRAMIGLVPLGPDAATRLEEFALWIPDGELPRRDARGALHVGPRTCPVFVLLPGARGFSIGSQADDPGAPRYDRYREALEPELGVADVEPFYASKYELTHGQYTLLELRDLAAEVTLPISPIGPEHPVMNLDFPALRHLLRAWGLRLPTAEEWEYLARGGSDDPWWTGADPRSLEGHENLADQTLLGIGGKADDPWVVDWEDGFARTAPVGSFPPNGLGLHDVLGNVCELCSVRRADGRSAIDLRGGSWHQGWRRARVTDRANWSGQAIPSIGLRPVLSATSNDN